MIGCDRQDRVVFLTINEPPVNVLTTALCSELSMQLNSLVGDDGIAAVLLSGAGKCFSAGASVEEHAQATASAMLEELEGTCLTLANFPAPVVAMVHGLCLGGALELAQFCDFVVADPGAKFGQPEIQLAFFPPLACQRLPRLIGYQNAAWLNLTGETIGAEAALALGLVQKIVPQADWGQLEQRFNTLSAPVLRLAKRALRGAKPAPPHVELAKMTDLFMNELYKIEDVQEGIASFKEKRAPVWRQR